MDLNHDRMARIEILVEEPSMKEFLTIFLPRILDDFWVLNQNVFIRSFQGKSDLQKNIPSKIKTYSNWHEPIGVVILQDQDSNDCVELKRKLVELCEKNGDCPTLIRIVCRELESWYLGDFEAIGKSYLGFKFEKYIDKSKFRDPDTCNAYHDLKKILPEFQKVDGAKKIAPNISLGKNRSKSFHQTVSGMRKLLRDVKG